MMWGQRLVLLSPDGPTTSSLCIDGGSQTTAHQSTRRCRSRGVLHCSAVMVHLETKAEDFMIQDFTLTEYSYGQNSLACLHA